MAMAMQPVFFLYMLVPITVCDDVFKLVNSSVQLDIQKKNETVSEDIDWTFIPKTLIARYNGNPPSRVYGSYKERVEFNEETYSLTLKNLQKSDSGIYEAEVAGETKDVVAKYQLHVLDPVEKPVLTASLQRFTADPKLSNCLRSIVHCTACELISDGLNNGYYTQMLIHYEEADQQIMKQFLKING
ncbi:hypothetical protein Q7C36_000350 [Tachysurus vachellii]|uniref:Immunoglobulin V-set domain-containing protein n=1 Tax=Tachysurus vachellii TaxID=175792 RepID=A0AA88P9R6_TACVA|nr:hypothetical protein Q7C36_000350 [Tachysurus vachellii]